MEKAEGRLERLPKSYGLDDLGWAGGGGGKLGVEVCCGGRGREGAGEYADVGFGGGEVVYGAEAPRDSPASWASSPLAPAPGAEGGGGGEPASRCRVSISDTILFRSDSLDPTKALTSRLRSLITPDRLS